MDDLDDVRAALGYKQLNLYGASYGTRAALVYLRQHEPHVRTVTLFGVSPTNQFMPRVFPQDTERALQGVLAECAGDTQCAKTFPNLQAETKLVLQRLIKAPVEVELEKGPAGNENQAQNAAPIKFKVMLSRDLVAEAIRYMLYNPAAPCGFPVLHLAAEYLVPLAKERLNSPWNRSDGQQRHVPVGSCDEISVGKSGGKQKSAANTFSASTFPSRLSLRVWRGGDRSGYSHRSSQTCRFAFQGNGIRCAAGE